MNDKPIDPNGNTWGIYVDGGLKHQIPKDFYESKAVAKQAYERVYGIGRVSVN